MEIRKTESRIFTEKLNAIKAKITEAGFDVQEREWRELYVQRKKGFFQLSCSFDYCDKENVLRLVISELDDWRRKFCEELEKKAGIKIVCYLR